MRRLTASPLPSEASSLVLVSASSSALVLIGISSAPEGSALGKRLGDIGVHSQERHTVVVVAVVVTVHLNGEMCWRRTERGTEAIVDKRATDASRGLDYRLSTTTCTEEGLPSRKRRNAYQRSKSSYSQTAARCSYTGTVVSHFFCRPVAQIAHHEAKIHPSLG